VIVDRKSDRFTQLLRAARTAATPKQITIGVHVADGAQPARDEGTTIIDVALANEFGVPELHIPQRSFIRDWYDERGAFAAQKMSRLLEESIRDTGNELQGVQRFALWAEADVRARIRRGIYPPNAERTKQLKGSSKPLIDRGQLIAAIRARIDGKIP
jgi:hypothetical protein